MLETWQFVTALVALLSTAAGGLIAAVWTVSNVRLASDKSVAAVERTTAVLGTEIRHLAEAIEKLYAKHDGVAETVRSLEHRLTLAEQSLSEVRKRINNNA